MVIFLARTPQADCAVGRREGNRCKKKGYFIQGLFLEIAKNVIIH